MRATRSATAEAIGDATPTQAPQIPARLSEVRHQAWRTALEITDIYEKIPPAQCPGIAGLVKDIRAAQASVGRGAELDLDRLDADALVTRNPHFWRAALELSPADGSFLLLHATLLASAGEIWRAHRILTATTQLLPISPEARPYYLAPAYGVGSVMVMSAKIGEATASSPDEIGRLEQALTPWPDNAIVLSELVDARLRDALGRARILERPDRSAQENADLQAALKQYHADVDRLFALDPIRAAPFRGEAAQRQRAQELRVQWAKLSDSDSALGYKEIRDLAETLEAVDIPELALVIYRIEVVARGFPGPSDLAAWRRLLPKLIGPEETEKLFAAAERGEINVVELDQTDPPRLEDWKGDPAIHPLVLQQVQREIADLSFRIEVLQGNPEEQAETLRQRALQKSRAGLYDAAIADIEAAMKVVGRQPALLLDEVGMYSALGRTERAEALLHEAELSKTGRRLALRERGLLRFGQGRYAEALQALRDDAKKDPRAIYSAVMADLAARRSGQSPQRDLLQRANRQLPVGSWPEACLAYLTGKISDDRLIGEAQKGDGLEIAQRLCEAYFILAETALASGDRARAIDFLESCIGTGITGYVEFRLARLELRRLAPEREERTHLWERKPAAPRTGPSNPESDGPHDNDGGGEDVPV